MTKRQANKWLKENHPCISDFRTMKGYTRIYLWRRKQEIQGIGQGTYSDEEKAAAEKAFHDVYQNYLCHCGCGKNLHCLCGKKHLQPGEGK